MIHCSRSMPSGNFDEPVTASNPPPASPRAFRFPCEYYSSPVSEVRPIFPKWMPYGCGAASAVVIILLFVGGALLSGPYLASAMDFVVSSAAGEIRGMYAPDVTAAQKQRFDDELKQMRDALEAGRISVKNMQPFLKVMQTTIADKKVTGEELEQLTRAAARTRTVNR